MKLRTRFIASHMVPIVALCLFFLVSQTMLRDVSMSLEAIKTERIVKEKLLYDARDGIYAIQQAILNAGLESDSRRAEMLHGNLHDLDARANGFYDLLAQLKETFKDKPGRIQDIHNAFQAYFIFAKRWLKQSSDPGGGTSLDVIRLFRERQHTLLDLIDQTATEFADALDQDFIAVNLRLAQISRAQGLLVLGGAILSLFLSLLLSRVLAKPIQHFITAVRQVEKGGYATIIASPQSDELGELAQAFNRMTAAIGEKQRSLTRAEERYRSIFENAVEGMFQTSPEGQALAANPAMAHILGYSSVEGMVAELNDVKYQLYAHADDRDRFLELMLRGEAVHDFEVQLLRRNGELFWARLHANPILDSEGSLVRIDGILEDISSAKAAELELAAYRDHLKDMVEKQTRELNERNAELARAVNDLILLNDRLQGLVDNSPDAIYLKDEQGRLVLTNERFDRTFRTRHPSDHAQGSSPLLTLESGSLLASLERKALEENRPVHQESPLYLKGSHHIFLVTVFPILDASGAVCGLCGMLSDITRERLVQMEAIHSAQLASIGELASGVAHEINNPINGIINYAQMIRDMQGDTSESPAIAGRIIKEGERIATIVKSLLTFSRKPNSRKQRVSLHDILQEVLNLTTAQLSRHSIVLDMHWPDGLPPVKANFIEIQQVLINLITNARHALSGKENGDRILAISGSRVRNGNGQDMVRVTVLDHGPGVSPSLLGKLFDPFFTTKPPGEGTGLGLYLSRRIVQDHGGRLEVQSREGEFTSFHMDLPVAG